MPVEGHDPEWPDKVVYAGMLLVMGGVIGALFAAMQGLGLTAGTNTFPLFDAFAWWWMVAMSVVMMVTGVLTVRHQAWVWAAIGILASLLSMAFYGVVALLGLLSAIALVKARLEGEEMIHDDVKVHAHEWPDKAIMAGLFLTGVGVVSLLQAALGFADRYGEVYLTDAPAVMAAIALVIGIFCIVAGRIVHRLRHSWVGWLAGIFAIVPLGFLVIGPALAVGALILLALAEREGEFREQAS